MDFLEFAQPLVKEGTLRAIKAIREVFQSNPCGQVPAETERKFLFFKIDLVGFSGALTESCSCLGHLTLMQQMEMSPALCSRVVQVVSSSLA